MGEQVPFHTRRNGRAGRRLGGGDLARVARALAEAEAPDARALWSGRFAHALDDFRPVYVTINDAEIDGERRPFEIFVNSKNMEHYAWTLGLTRMISAVFRRGGDVSFVPEELKAVFDPRGGGWINGRYVPSLLAVIGGVIERHLAGDAAVNADTQLQDAAPTTARPVHSCPRCGGPALVRKEGCDTCMDCGYSKCG